MDDKSLAADILRLVGGADNVVGVLNCMTRVRITVRDGTLIRVDDLRALDDVLAIVHDQACYAEVVVGPGKSEAVARELRALGAGGAGQVIPAVDINASKGHARVRDVARHLMKSLGQIFAPLIPGIIAAGLCAGIASLLAQAYPGYADVPALNVVYNLLSGISSAFMTYICAWAGYRAAEAFGGTPILGGMLGMFTTLDNVNAIATSLGLYNDAQPLNAVLRSGRGGVLAAVVGVWIMCQVEHRIRRRMPNALDTVFTPLVTLVATLVPYVLIVMPALGFVSTALCDAISAVAMSENPLVRMVAGYIGAAVFLPLVAMGMHHGLIAVYTAQLDQFGYVTFYPALAMAGAGMVGASVALALKCRRVGNQRLLHVINGALPAGLLGIGEPLIYGVMLPLGRPLITAGLGAGFGGAFVMLMEVASTTWGPSGLVGTFVMTEGPHGAIASMGCYLAGLAIAATCGFIITNFVVGDSYVEPAV